MELNEEAYRSPGPRRAIGTSETAGGSSVAATEIWSGCPGVQGIMHLENAFYVATRNYVSSSTPPPRAGSTCLVGLLVASPAWGLLSGRTWAGQWT